jgi:hypothetical protein
VGILRIRIGRGDEGVGLRGEWWIHEEVKDVWRWMVDIDEEHIGKCKVYYSILVRGWMCCIGYEKERCLQWCGLDPVS